LPDKRMHRGAAPQDNRLFAESVQDDLQRAVRDLSWLLTGGYAAKSSLKLVGDRFELTQRQRIAVMRCACSDHARALRQDKQITTAELAGGTLLLDGYNIITTVEAALGGAVVLKARDGCFRDIAGLHGTYRKVQETIPAINLIGQFLRLHHVGRCIWYLDRPVSNSGRLKTLILQIAEQQRADWQVKVVYNPDDVLSQSDHTIATADSVVLDRCSAWCNLARHLVEQFVPDAFVVDLSA